MMLANFAAKLSSISDKEVSDAGRALTDELRFPFIVTDTAQQPIVARGIGDGLREKISADTLTPVDRKKIAKLIENMDRTHTPIPMKGVVADEGRKIIGYIYYDQTRWSLNPGSTFVVTDIAEEPILWLNVDGVDSNATISSVGDDADIEQLEEVKANIRSFVEKSKEKGYSNPVQFNPPYESLIFHYGNTGLIHQLQWWMPLA